ncbi:hypothetical protein Lal_00046571, partial [Lupinus albus]
SNTGILHSINPEIDRTYHRLVRQNRTLDTNFVSVSEHLVAENTASEHSFLNIDIDIDVPYTSLYTCHACTDSELCDSCIDDFLNIVVDSPVTHSHCTNTIDAGIRQQSDLFVQVQAATKPSFATFFPSVLQAPDWTPPFDLECDIAVYALGTILASYEFDFLPP